MSPESTTGVRHIPWAFRLDDATSLPLTGDRHPLRREFARWLTWASGVTLVVCLAAFGGWAWWSSRAPEEAPVLRQVKIVRYTDLGVPPSLAKPTAPQVNVAQAVADLAAPPPVIAVPEPVPDEQAQTQTIATVDQMAAALEPLTLTDIGSGVGTGDSLVVDLSGAETSPAPNEFVAVDEEPVRLRIDNPVYPDVALAAGIEGTVVVRVLVGKNGKVKNVIVLEGPEALRGAADRCARTAVFKPAIIDNKPLEVWVMMPITFKTRS
jgi:TonB family protein